MTQHKCLIWTHILSPPNQLMFVFYSILNQSQHFIAPGSLLLSVRSYHSIPLSVIQKRLLCDITQ
uniref:Uncharacterized protein n=1 Tax=Anguilla anguilla TaxID=7936 RepID=A0A0E9RC95_ANGAN